MLPRSKHRQGGPSKTTVGCLSVLRLDSGKPHPPYKFTLSPRYMGRRAITSKLNYSKIISPLKMTIDQLLAVLVEKYEASHTLSKKVFERAQQVLPSGSTRSVLVSEPFPMVVKLAKQSHITTVDGLTFEDFVSDFSAGIYGHSHPVIQDAVQQALSTGFSLGAITEKEAELAEILTHRFPSYEKVRFCNSGTEANTFALATAIAYTQRKKVCLNKIGLIVFNFFPIH